MRLIFQIVTGFRGGKPDTLLQPSDHEPRTASCPSCTIGDNLLRPHCDDSRSTETTRNRPLKRRRQSAGQLRPQVQRVFDPSARVNLSQVRGYATLTLRGRSHASKHHFVPERFFGRSANRRGTEREGIFSCCPWGHEGETAVYCYECHEELLHNPVLLPEDIERFAALVRERGLNESVKAEGTEMIAGRIKLFHEIISAGMKALSSRLLKNSTYPKA